MSVFQSFREILKQRLQALLWRSMASDVETDVILHDVANLERIEQRARQYEADGKPHLADMLRQRAAKLDTDSPGGSITTALQSLSGDPGPASLALTTGGAQDDKKPENKRPALPSPRRNRRRRTELPDEAPED